MKTAEEGRPGELQERIWSRVLPVLMCASFALDYSAMRTLYPLEAYANGQADVPCRIFPILVMQAARHIPFMHKLAAHVPVAAHSTDALVVLLLAFFGMLTAVWATGKTMEALGVSRSVSVWARLLVVIGSFFSLTPAWGLNYTLPYDVPALAFCSLGVWLIVSGRIAWFYPLFCLATLNRETSCFLVLFFVVWTITQQATTQQTDWQQDNPRSWRYIAAHVSALTVLWFIVKLVPTHLSHGHAFSTSSHLLERIAFNVKELYKPQQWPVFASTCGFALPILWLGRRWVRHRAFTLSVGITLACWLVGVIGQGIIVEIRVFGEWAALLCPMLGLMIAHRLQAPGLQVTTLIYPTGDLVTTEEIAA